MICYWRRKEKHCSKYWSPTGDLSVDDDEELVQQGRRYSTKEIIRSSDSVCLWYRIFRLLPKVPNILEIKDAIIQGDEKAIRTHYRKYVKTREQLIEEARSLNVPYYGRLTKKQLQKEIKRFKEHKAVRQRFERKSQGPSSF